MKNMMNNLVCIILVNYNGINLTKQCIESILRSTYKYFKIIVVENCSKDKSIILGDDYINSHCDVVITKFNGGFSYGNNVGIQYCLKKYNPKFIFLLNNDTEIDKDCLRNLIDFYNLENNKKNLGLITGKIYNYYTNKVDYLGGAFNSKSGLPYYFHSLNETKITFATGAFWFIPTESFLKIGYLDETFFMYCEDSEYCARIISLDMNILYCDNAYVYHKISQSSNKSTSKFSQFYIIRNTFILLDKIYKKSFYKKILFVKIMIINVIKKKINFLIFLKAFFAYLKKEKGPTKCKL